MELPAEAERLLRSTALAHPATINKDGSPQVTPLWIDVEDGKPVMNTAVGRLKERNIRRDPRISLEVTDPEDSEVYVEIRGTAALVLEGARDHAHRLAMKYTGAPIDNFQPGVDRITIVVTPHRVLFHNS
jgi:PPOX class probable F420-dependent enzyme